MKKQILFSAILMFAIILFNSCEKEALETPVTAETSEVESTNTITDTPKDSLKDNATVNLVKAQIDRIDSTLVEHQDQLENRSGRTLIQEFDVTMSEGFWFLKGYYKHDLNANYRYIARVIPYSGDPDLYVHGRKPGSDGDWRIIRSSKGPGLNWEESSAMVSDLYSSEDRLYFNVYAQTYTRFKLQIFKEYVCTTGCLAGKYFIKSALGTFLDVQGGSPASGTNVWAYNYNGSAAQKWNLIHAGNNYYYIKSDLGTYLDVYGGVSTSGTNVWAYAFNGTLAQKWYVYQTGDGYYYIASALGTYLDVYGAFNASGTNVWAYRFNGTVAQKWQMIKQ